MCEKRPGPECSKRGLSVAALERIVAAVVLLLSAPLFAQDAKLIEAAKNEGRKVVGYGSLEGDTTEAVRKAFEQKTGLNLEYWRASTTKVVDRATTEYRAKKSLVDVILVHDAEMRHLFKGNVVARYDSPRFKEFTKESIDPQLGPRYRDTIIGVVYNKSVVKPEDAPKSLEDLLKPQFRGKIAMPDRT